MGGDGGGGAVRGAEEEEPRWGGAIGGGAREEEDGPRDRTTHSKILRCIEQFLLLERFKIQLIKFKGLCKKSSTPSLINVI
jgi:hypothetical protein